MSLKDQFLVLLGSALKNLPKELLRILIEYYWFDYQLKLINHHEIVISDNAKFRLDCLKIRETTISTYLGFVGSEPFNRGNLTWKIKIETQSQEALRYSTGICQVLPEIKKSPHFDDIISYDYKYNYYTTYWTEKNYTQNHEFKVDLDTNKLFIKKGEIWVSCFAKNISKLGDWAPYIGFYQVAYLYDHAPIISYCDVQFESS